MVDQPKKRTYSRVPFRSVGLASWKKKIWNLLIIWMNWRSMFCNVSLFSFNALTRLLFESMTFFGITALHIRSRRLPHFAKSDPLCGVPRNSTPYVETKIDRKCSVLVLRISDEYINALFTTNPPSECATKMIGRSFALRIRRFAASTATRCSAWLCILSFDTPSVKDVTSASYPYTSIRACSSSKIGANS